MIDIHSHILPNVDDGSKSVEKSLEMLKTEYNGGVTDVILTPHKRNSYNFSPEQIKLVFGNFVKIVKKNNISINLHLGREIAVNRNLYKVIDSGELTLADSKYILLEFPLNRKSEFFEEVNNVRARGFIPVIAHLERYPKVSLDSAYEILGAGGLIQINSTSITDFFPYRIHSFVMKLLKKDLVSFIASDVHENRVFTLDKAQKIVEKKFGEEKAQKLFIDNPKAIIENRAIDKNKKKKG